MTKPLGAGLAAAGLPGVETILDQALVWLGRKVGFDEARAPTFDTEVLIPVSFAASGPVLDFEHALAACHNEQAETDVHKFADLARLGRIWRS